MGVTLLKNSWHLRVALKVMMVVWVAVLAMKLRVLILIFQILKRRETEPLAILEILDRFCLKVKEEAMISNKAVERIRSVTISL